MNLRDILLAAIERVGGPERAMSGAISRITIDGEELWSRA